MHGSQGGLSNAARWLGLALNHAEDSRRVKPQNMLHAGNLAALSNYLLSLSPLQQFSLIAMKINAIQHTRSSMRIGMLVRSSVHTANQFYILLLYCVKSYLNSSLFDHNSNSWHRFFPLPPSFHLSIEIASQPPTWIKSAALHNVSFLFQIFSLKTLVKWNRYKKQFFVSNFG